MNRTLKLLIASDTLWLSGMGLVSPILAIYITDSLNGALTAVGIATAIFLIIRLILQLIFSKVFSAKHRYFMVVVGAFIISTVPFIYMFSTNIFHLYIAQVVYGIGAGLGFPAWFSLFASSLTKGREGFEWSVYTAFVAAGTGITAYFGSLLANKFGFNLIFFLAGCLSLAGMIILLGLQKQNLKKILPSEMFVNKHKSPNPHH
jgi:MFS family permease